MKLCSVHQRAAVFAAALLSLTLPAVLQGEILRLKDGSQVRGKVVSFDGDTLVFAPSFGGQIHVYREEIAVLVFDETGAAKTTPDAATVPAGGPGSVSVVFKNDKLTSKVAVDNKSKSIEDELERANWIEQLLIVGEDTVYARIDTTKDKTVYKGHEKELKNIISLEDMTVSVPSGVYKCVVVVRNVGAAEHESAFSEGPLDLSIVFETVGVYTNQTTTLQVGISKGFMRMGRPKFVPVE